MRRIAAIDEQGPVEPARVTTAAAARAQARREAKAASLRAAGARRDGLAGQIDLADRFECERRDVSGGQEKRRTVHSGSVMDAARAQAKQRDEPVYSSLFRTRLCVEIGKLGLIPRCD